MDKIEGNYTNQSTPDFPFDCETLAYISTNRKMCEMLGNIAGDKIILQGCTLSATNYRDEGYLFLCTEDNPTGEILRWVGGSTASGMHIVNTDISVNEDYPKAYTTRTLAPGQGSEGDEAYSWDNFTTLACTKDIKASLDALTAEVHAITQEPLGVIKMWAGTTIPTGYHLCDGSALLISEYPLLSQALGTAFNTANDMNGSPYTTSSGYFRLPDLRGRFVVGASFAGYDYNILGGSGGSKEVTLTENQIPAHRHYAACSDDVNRQEHASLRAQYDLKYVDTFSSFGDENAGPGGILQTSATGGGQPHENRPPYYVLAYIIKLS
jgi:microcystin-dependent protein